MDYQAQHEILLSAPDDRIEFGYFITVSQTLSSLLNHQQIFPLMGHNVNYQQQAVKNDDNLIFSTQQENFGSCIDDKNLVIQLYIDDSGLTNPISFRKNLYMMTTVHFLPEDVSNKF